MSHAAVDPAQAASLESETPEPADDNGYRVLATSFIIGIAFIFIFFILMLVLLAGASS
ncbi:MAG TPA: hypothetical protein VKT82_32675 [Ktedonobacterales bacterium]|nr:hypothetical protein [Ktedonobacterales bacterium]